MSFCNSTEVGLVSSFLSSVRDHYRRDHLSVTVVFALLVASPQLSKIYERIGLIRLDFIGIGSLTLVQFG